MLIGLIRNSQVQGLDISCVYLATRENRTHSKMVRIGKVGYHARLRDYHKSNPFGTAMSIVNEESMPPTPW